MGNKILNYSAVVNRKEKIYNFGNLNLSNSGIEFDVFKWVGLGVIIGFIIGTVFNLLTGTWRYWGTNFSLPYLIITLGGGGALGFALYNVRIGGYQLYQYLFAYFRKKHVHNYTDLRDIQELHNHKVNTLVRKEL